MNLDLYNEFVGEARKQSLIEYPVYGSISDREIVNAEREARFNELLIESVVQKCAQIAFDVGNTFSSSLCNSIGLEILEKFELDNRYKRGDRVQVIEGFNVGAHGVVEFVEPSGKVWVLRDHASKPVFYHPYELTLED